MTLPQMPKIAHVLSTTITTRAGTGSKALRLTVSILIRNAAPAQSLLALRSLWDLAGPHARPRMDGHKIISSICWSHAQAWIIQTGAYLILRCMLVLRFKRLITLGCTISMKILGGRELPLLLNNIFKIVFRSNTLLSIGIWISRDASTKSKKRLLSHALAMRKQNSTLKLTLMARTLFCMPKQVPLGRTPAPG